MQKAGFQAGLLFFAAIRKFDSSSQVGLSGMGAASVRAKAFAPTTK